MSSGQIETSDIVEGQRNYKSKRKSEKDVQAWPRTLLQARTQNFWYIDKPTFLLNWRQETTGLKVSAKLKSR